MARTKPRDVAGYVERIGPDRWRLVMPKPHFESQLDVMELVPLSKERVDEEHCYCWLPPR